MDLDVVKVDFEKKAHSYRQLKEEALFILEPAISNANIKLHSITHRVKNVDSFIDKIQRKQSETPFEDIRDIVGIRVICLFLSDIERIGNVIRESFKVLEEDNKVEGADVSSFGYMSVHFIATMKAEHSGPRYDPIANLPLEIQVRTIAMDAWANVSHYLSYKSEKDVPSELRRDFYALSGLFYVADRHFEMFFRSSRESQAQMAELFSSPTSEEQLKQEINLDSLKAYMRERFPDRRYAGDNFTSELVKQLNAAQYESIKDIQRKLDIGWDAFLAYEKDYGKDNYGNNKTPHFADVAAIRLTLNIVDDKFSTSDKDRLPKVYLTGFEKYRKLVKRD
jgi:putative GTP pyrophosphokinase